MQAEIDTSKPHAARIYDYLLGGKDHFAVDRETAEKGIKFIPTGRTAARENRSFLGRAVRYLVAEAGIRQFLDIGPACPAPTTCTRWHRRRHPSPGWSTSTTTRSCLPTPGRC